MRRKRLAAMGGGDDCRLPREQHTDLAMRLTWCVLRGCRLMSLTNAQLMEFIAWKCAHMVDAADLARTPRTMCTPDTLKPWPQPSAAR